MVKGKFKSKATFMAMSKAQKVYVIGEGVNDPKEIFGTTRNLKKNLAQKESGRNTYLRKCDDRLVHRVVP